MAGKTKQEHEFEDSGQWQGNNTYLSVYLNVCVYVYIYVCMCVYMYIKRDVYVYVHLYIILLNIICIYKLTHMNKASKISGVHAKYKI